ncbi:hypothetical protein CWI38_1925p0010 [Hamiltosporidium tvaerminnensis]|uniref:Uncharacterized protein n=1 Tax=Hamiltosporidium tvaerminnensis TaxID=1176355 RepID=A0A4Q9LP50_9MICR|nr:hypothetical protein CWI38_1925p0010 [Hamiltosporidium tvaerminnensis]
MTQVLQDTLKDKNKEKIENFLLNLYNLPKYEKQKEFIDKEFINTKNIKNIKNMKDLDNVDDTKNIKNMKDLDNVDDIKESINIKDLDKCYVIDMLRSVICMWSDIENNRKDKFYYLICKIIECLVSGEGDKGRVEGVSNSIGRLEGVSKSIGKLEGVSNCIGRLEGVSNIIGRLEGVSNSTNKQQGASNSTNKQQGVINSTNKQQGTSNSTNEQDPVNNNLIEQHPVNNNLIQQHPFNHIDPHIPDYSVMTRQDIIFKLFLEIKELEIKNFILRVLIEKKVLNKEDKDLLIEYISKCKDISTLNVILERCNMLFGDNKEYYRDVICRIAMIRGVSKRVRGVLFSIVDGLKERNGVLCKIFVDLKLKGNIGPPKGMCQHCGKSSKTVYHLETRCEKMPDHDNIRRYNEVVRYPHLLLNRYKFKSSKHIRSHSHTEIRLDIKIKTDAYIQSIVLKKTDEANTRRTNKTLVETSKVEDGVKH